MELVAVPLENGGVIVVEMDDAQAGVVKAGRLGKIVGESVQTLEAALEPVIPAVQSVLATLRQAGPHEITVEFGVKLTAETGAVIVKAASMCHLTVTLCWKRDDEPAG